MPCAWAILILLWTFAPFSLLAAQPKTFRVKHSPESPRSGEIVHITATVRDANEAGAGRTLVLQYQIVEPGHYVERTDSAFKRNWVPLAMNHGNDGAWSAEIPASAQQHRRLIRYRIAEGETVVAPAPEDTQPNFAYFVYDGVPAWRGAINP